MTQFYHSGCTPCYKTRAVIIYFLTERKNNKYQSNIFPKYLFYDFREPYVTVSLTQDDTLSGLLPYFHIYGLTMGLSALALGTRFVVFPKFDPELFLTAIQKYKVLKKVKHLSR